MIERVLIVGYGSIGKRHLRIAREVLLDADIRVLRHQPYGAIPQFADGCFSSLTEACTFAPQVAVIANPAPFHLDVAQAMAAAGCHLLIEKPLSYTASGVLPLLQQIREQNLILQIGYNLRFLPSLEQFRKRIHTGAIGRVLSVRCEVGQYLPCWRPDTDYRLGVSARQELGGGVLLELSHELDYLRWIFGEVTWVSAWLGRQSALEIDVEDTAHLTLGFARHVLGLIPVATLSLDFIRHDTMRLCTAIGEQGSLRWNGLTGEVEERPAGSSGWHLVFHHTSQRDDSYRTQWQNFLSCVQTGRTPCVTGEDGLAVMEIIDAARQSAAEQGTHVPISNTEG
jgi:predicted dehydrogenase